MRLRILTCSCIKRKIRSVSYTHLIHARPAGILVKQAAGYQSSVKITKGDKTADAKRIFGVMGLGGKTGEEVTITVE